jgi:hypothetical protein
MKCRRYVTATMSAEIDLGIRDSGRSQGTAPAAPARRGSAPAVTVPFPIVKAAP